MQPEGVRRRGTNRRGGLESISTEMFSAIGPSPPHMVSPRILACRPGPRRDSMCQDAVSRGWKLRSSPAHRWQPAWLQALLDRPARRATRSAPRRWYRSPSPNPQSSPKLPTAQFPVWRCDRCLKPSGLWGTQIVSPRRCSLFGVRSPASQRCNSLAALLRTSSDCSSTCWLSKVISTLWPSGSSR